MIDQTLDQRGSYRISENKRVVERYLDRFRTSDHELILSCLTEDIAIENDAFLDRPTITIPRMAEVKRR